MGQKFYKFLLTAMGWEIIGTKVPENHCLILEAPHTSLLDFLIGFMYYRAVGGRLTIMAKKELFFFPLGNILRAMGTFPIDRSSASRTIVGIVREMKSNPDEIHMVMCPEGTRKAIRKWKTGYHTIVKRSGIPLYLSCIDWGHKRVGIFCKWEEPLTDDPRADTDKIQARYEQEGFIARHPEKYLTR